MAYKKINGGYLIEKDEFYKCDPEFKCAPAINRTIINPNVVLGNSRDILNQAYPGLESHILSLLNQDS